MAWALYSSMVSSPNPQISGTSRSGITGGLGNGLGTGFGSGGLGSGTGSGFTFPNLNFGFGSISWPSSPLTFHLPGFFLNLSFLNFFLHLFNFHFVPHSSGASGQSGANNSTSPNGGGGGGAGNAFRIIVSIETVYILLAGVFVAVILIMVTQMVRTRKEANRQDEPDRESEVEPPGPGAHGRISGQANSLNYNFTEQIVPFYAWHKDRKLLDFGIPGDLPLTWSTDLDLAVSSAPGSSLLMDNTPVESPKGSESMVRLKNLCTPFYSTSGAASDLKVVRGVSCGEDIVRLFRLNMVNERDYAYNMTPREIAMAMHNTDRTSDLKSLLNISSAFSRVFYGKKDASMSTYQDFLRNLSKAIHDARVFTCGGS